MLKKKSKSQTFLDHASDLADKIAPHVENARDKAAPVIADAREKAAPVLADAREKAAPTIDSARAKFNSDVLPLITAAVAAATEATEDARGEAKRRGLATAAALKGEVEAPKKTHKLRNLLALVGLAGVGAFIAKKLSDREASTAWQSSYTPTPAGTAATRPVDETPMGTAAAAAARGDDEGAAGPDEAASDAADSPHSVTTPDNPVEEIDVSDKNK